MSKHIPVLAEDVLKFAKESMSQPQTFLDATFGRGGHTRLILDTFPQLKVVAADRDEQAISYGRDTFAKEIEDQKILFLHAALSEIVENKEPWSRFLQKDGFDLILIDLGVSSPQLDQGDRGFSFYHEGPLDMRMDQRQELTAYHIVNEWGEKDLSDLFFRLGEVHSPYRVVKSILDSRSEKPIETTNELADLITRTLGWKTKGKHPATQYFLALRLAVNDELGQVENEIPKAMELLNPCGRMIVITFHSLEDRIVKNLFKSSNLGKPVNKKVIQASWNEKKSNPRARSAKLRVFERESL